ncbi:MAG: sugar transferase [Mariniblastus sp.]|nr:sugar transferase [Mariniblastus sp.]
MPSKSITIPTQLKPIPVWKRTVDLVGATLGLVVLSPLLIAIAVHVKIFSSGPVFFKHQRFGYLGQPIFVWKFRSMHIHTNPDVHQQHVLELTNDDVQLNKLNNDAQLIFLGKWLRCTAMDELPQLINVIKGEMSLVGPRPDVIPINQYREWQRIRFIVHPGLTGLWQVSGKNNTTFNEMNRLDADYVQRRSLWLDTKIILLTIPSIIQLVLENSSETQPNS